MPRRGCARGAKTCMLGAGPPRDGIIRTSPGQECSKDKGALPGARRISVYAARFRSATGCKTRVCFRPYHLILHLGEKRVSLCSAKRQSARSSMDRASDYGSEGWGFESLRARSGPPRCDPPVGVLHFYLALLRECFFMPIRLWRARQVGLKDKKSWSEPDLSALWCEKVWFKVVGGQL